MTIERKSHSKWHFYMYIKNTFHTCKCTNVYCTLVHVYILWVHDVHVHIVQYMCTCISFQYMYRLLLYFSNRRISLLIDEANQHVHVHVYNSQLQEGFLPLNHSRIQCILCTCTNTCVCTCNVLHSIFWTDNKKVGRQGIYYILYDELQCTLLVF